MIEQFYKHLVANEFDAMNALVQGPLLRSKAWKDHWNAKNLGIFSRNLVGNLNLDNLFLLPIVSMKPKNLGNIPIHLAIRFSQIINTKKIERLR